MAEYKFVGNDRIESKHWAVAFVDLGEGNCGDWDENDPNDYPHLRFDYYSRETPKSEWDIPDDSSYCCQLNSATITKKEMKKALVLLLKHVMYEPHYFRVKRIGEEMSYLCEDDLV